MKRILVIQTASIGDVILATPVLEKLNKHFPDTNIDVLVKKGNQALFFAHPFIHRVLVWDKSEQKTTNLFRLIRFIRQSKYDLVVNLQRFFSTGLLTVLSGAGQKIGFDKNPMSFLFTEKVKHSMSEGQHEIERNLSLVKPFTSQSNTSVKLYPTPREAAKMSQYKTTQFITISPASLWFTKQYPEEKWEEFLKMIPEDVRIYFLGSANDMDLCERIAKNSNLQNFINLAGKLSFLESAELMKDAKMNYVNDSAPMHLASAVDAPVTAIYCSTISGFGFGPLSEDSIIVETDQNLSCRPCGLHGKNSCPEKHFKCAMSINNQKLLDRLVI